MKSKTSIALILLLSLCSCQKDYTTISSNELKKLVIQDTLVVNNDYLVLSVGESNTDEFPNLLVQKDNLFLFNYNCGLENDSVINSYYSAFVIDSDGEFRKNGIWVYCKFSTEGNFPFQSKVRHYSVDSIPENWNGIRPTQEGIYFFENNALKLFSNEQSEEKFKEYEKDGFYFIPNKGRLFDKIPITDLGN